MCLCLRATVFQSDGKWLRKCELSEGLVPYGKRYRHHFKVIPAYVEPFGTS